MSIAAFLLTPCPRLRLPRPTHRHNFPTCTYSSSADSDFRILSHRRIFHRYQTVYQRDVQYPDGRQVSFDLLGNARSDYTSVFVFPFHTRTSTVTLLEEYQPSQNTPCLSLVAGMFDLNKHDTPLQAACLELSEEARLIATTMIPLSSLPIPADKYSLNRFHFFLAIDPLPEQQPSSQRDVEEWIHIPPPVSVHQIPSLVATAKLNVPHSLCALLALNKLASLGLYLPQ